MNHIKKTLSLSLLTFLAAPSLATADSNTTLYGQTRVSVDSVDDDEDRVVKIADTESRFGVKGFETVGNGLKLVFQLEVGVNLDNGGASTGSFFIGGRNSYVGLDSGFGALALGIHDTPHREATDKIDIFGNTLADHNTIIGNVGDGDTASEFNQREPNTINYWSPKFNGFQFKGQYRVDETDGVDQDRYSVGGYYENGPLFAAVGYELHGSEGSLVDPDGLGPLPAVGTNDTQGIKVGLAYAFNDKNTRVGFIYDRISEDDADTVFDRDAFYVNLSHKLDNNVFKVGYAHADESDASVGNDGADFYFVGVSHNFSKRTEVYGLYAATENDDNGRYGLGISTNGQTPTSAPGADLNGVSLGFIHKF